jgi:hypothetical protein
VFVDLTTGIDGEDIDQLGISIHGEQYAPATDAGLSNSGPLGEWRGEAWIEWASGKLPKASANTPFGPPIKAIEDLFGFVRDTDPKTHRPRSRS